MTTQQLAVSSCKSCGGTGMRISRSNYDRDTDSWDKSTVECVCVELRRDKLAFEQWLKSHRLNQNEIKQCFTAYEMEEFYEEYEAARR